ncbi:hypothetical protein [Porphyrobacter sp. YT40]|uniref:hypothetical protein n=1 Tax=Porphyrobacter sp. YT40 TaxID=2547601 RepID=UPI0011416BE9|nr:hypothetical protein [Porphyrobacter sp. YT40]QDH34925.1 hypothetical protein E2E27_11665 [Porphyrobacter sp. YT40]
MTNTDDLTTIADDDDNSLGARFRRFAIPVLWFAAGLTLLLSGIAWGAIQVAKNNVASVDLAGSVVAGIIGAFIVVATFRKWPTLTQGDPVTPRTRRYSWAMVALIGFSMLITLVFARPSGGRLANDLYSNGPLPTDLAVGAALLWLVGMPLLAAITRRNMDEVERNLLIFGESAGFRFFTTVAPAWWLGYRGGVLPQPDVMILFVGVLVASFIANMARRLT